LLVLASRLLLLLMRLKQQAAHPFKFVLAALGQG